MKRTVKTFQDSPVSHVIESETIDYDSRSFAFSTFGHEDPSIITVTLGRESRTLTRDAMKEGFQCLLDAIDATPAQGE
ncbi:MAG: hypothetical protein P1U75_05795 [Antarcticimicrobium sp.]|uniref:hypothetical protein n=1 Tax=Antarcticimicrobium sp. TaxID=2824147 RepID=UPI002612A510|nr:hypothetical protein [Antarcticimicrobium sp.]MDF1716170.1 hypothetical protein [Antarcticimicrobium sp.]